MALTARNAGQRASDLVEILDPAVALDFDLACSLRLLHHDNSVQEAQAKRIAYEVCKMAFGEQ